jgi:hypothetical protein
LHNNVSALQSGASSHVFRTDVDGLGLFCRLSKDLFVFTADHLRAFCHCCYPPFRVVRDKLRPAFQEFPS